MRRSTTVPNSQSSNLEHHVTEVNLPTPKATLRRSPPRNDVMQLVKGGVVQQDTSFAVKPISITDVYPPNSRTASPLHHIVLPDDGRCGLVSPSSELSSPNVSAPSSPKTKAVTQAAAQRDLGLRVSEELNKRIVGAVPKKPAKKPVPNKTLRFTAPPAPKPPLRDLSFNFSTVFTEGYPALGSGSDLSLIL